MKAGGAYFWLRVLRIGLAFVSVTACLGAVWFFRGGEKIFLSQAGSDLLKVISGAAAGAASALALIVLLTVLLGRAYCSILCPLGILQDCMSFFRKKNFKRNKWQRSIRYIVLAFAGVCALCGLMLPLTLLVPSSSFVWIVNNVFREVVQWAGNVVHFLSEPISVRPAVWTMVLGWVFFIGLLILVRWKGRIYCNTLCPVGAILGLLSRFSLFRIRIQTDRCVSCGACERVCKGGCIDAAAKKVDVEECVGCMNCLGECKLDAIHYTCKKDGKASLLAPEKEKSAGTGQGPVFSRRAFLGTLGAAAAGAACAGTVRLLGGSVKEDLTVPMPPGAGDFDSFTSKCLGCGLCIGSCRGKVLKQSITQYGVKGFMQPYLDLSAGACQYDCHRCQEVCPCGALTLMDLAKKQSCRIGLAQYFKERCVCYLKDMDCGACSEHCPVGALDMVTYKNTLIPKVNEKLCIGCGACQNICPVRPVPAIVVKGVTPQIFVEKPKKEKQTKLPSEDDFPF